MTNGRRAHKKATKVVASLHEHTVLKFTIERKFNLFVRGPWLMNILTQGNGQGLLCIHIEHVDPDFP